MCNHDYFIKVVVRDHNKKVVQINYCCVYCEEIIEVNSSEPDQEYEDKLVPDIGSSLSLHLTEKNKLIEGEQLNNFHNLIKGQAGITRVWMERMEIGR